MTSVDILLDEFLRNPQKIATLSSSDIEQYLSHILPLFQNEPALVKVDGDVAFVGDLHGDFETAIAIVKRLQHVDHLVFLGDYIDREPTPWGSLYTILYLLLLKLQNPRKIILLKGNHECNDIISVFPYEFDDELRERYQTAHLRDIFIDIFAEMPLMVLANSVFAAHGGIVKDGTLENLQHLRKNDRDALLSLVWSDPEISPMNRGIGTSFTQDELHTFLHDLHASVFVRGHSYATLGMSIYQDRCLTLFSCRQYQRMGNGGILVARTSQNIQHASELQVEDYSSGHWSSYVVKKI